jgi:hypothetical protein
MNRLLTGLVVLLVPLSAVAQNPDLVLTPAERDSVPKQYDQIFPIWGRKAIERGFDMPTPLGFNVGWFGATQDIIISDLAIGFNAPPEAASFIKFEKAESKINNWNARTDLWVFPFLNVYLMVGTGDGHTTVHVSEPVKFTTTADFKGSNIGLGVTGAFGFRRSFVVGDFNHQWGFSSLLENPVPVNVFSARLGRAFRIGERSKRMKATAWVGPCSRTCRTVLSDPSSLGGHSVRNGFPVQQLSELGVVPGAERAREITGRQLRWTPPGRARYERRKLHAEQEDGGSVEHAARRHV